MIGSGEVFLYPRDFLVAVGDVLHHLTLPALALGFTLAATVSRLSRSAMVRYIPTVHPAGPALGDRQKPKTRLRQPQVPHRARVS